MLNQFTKVFGKWMKNGFYVILFLCICAIGISGYVLFRQPAQEETVLSAPMPEQAPPFVPEIPVPEPTPAPSAPEPVRDTVEETVPEVVSAVSTAPVHQPVIYTMAVNGSVSLPFSGDELLESKTFGDWRTHGGVDIAAPEGTKVHAIADGTVRDVREDEMMGTTVVIEHQDDTVSTYCNLMKGVVVEAGDAVHAGDVIGGVGSTALAECLESPHLHLELRCSGELIDPMSVLPELAEE